MKEGKVVEACIAFEDSNRIEPRAGTLIRLGACREHNHQLASAYAAYNAALALVKDPSKKDIATAKLAELEPQVPHLTVALADADRLPGLEVSRDGQPFDLAQCNHRAPIDGGDYVLAAHAPGHKDWTVTVHVPEVGGDVTIAIPRLEDLPPQTVVAAVHVVPSSPSPWTGRRDLAVGLGGVAIAGFVVGAVAGKLAQDDQRDAGDVCPSPIMPCGNAAKAQSDNDAARKRALVANIGVGVGVAAVIAAGALWFTGGPHESRDLALVPDATTHGGGLALVGRF